MIPDFSRELFQGLPNRIEIDDFLSDIAQTNMATATEDLGSTFSKTLEIDGKLYLKSSVVTQLTADSKAKKVTLRPL